MIPFLNLLSQPSSFAGFAVILATLLNAISAAGGLPSTLAGWAGLIGPSLLAGAAIARDDGSSRQ